MADDQTSYDENEGDVPETGDSDVQTSTVVVPSADASSTPVVEGDDYDDDAPIEDYVVNLVVNEQPDGVTLSPDLVNAAITDINGNIIGNKPNLYDSLSTAVYDQLNNNTYIEDADSGELRRPHHIDLKTGVYRGRQVLEPKEDY